MKNEITGIASINEVIPHSKTKRTCRNANCDKDITHLPYKFKFCTLTCRYKYNTANLCKKRKKPRTCIECGKPYDYLSRDKKQMCSDKCETKHKNNKKVKGWGKNMVGDTQGSTRCQRCGVAILKGKFHCNRCNKILRELNLFKKEFGCGK